MTYDEWEQEVLEVIRVDPVWRFYAYRKALFLYDLVWEDCEKLMRDLRFVICQLPDSLVWKWRNYYAQV